MTTAFMRIIPASIAVLSLLWCQSAFAQTGTGSTQTGSVVTDDPTAGDILGAILRDADVAVPDSIREMQVPAKQQASWESESQTIRKRMADIRAECREAVRRSNRDERMQRILQCERALLLLESNLLRKESPYLTAVRLRDPVIVQITTAIADLESAMMTIVDGIDAGIFTNENQLLAARTNLRTTYREPYWQAKADVRRDRELTFLYFISKELMERPDLESPELLTVARCIETAISQYQGGPSPCLPLIRELAEADRQAASEAAKSGASGNGSK